MAQARLAMKGASQACGIPSFCIHPSAKFGLSRRLMPQIDGRKLPVLFNGRDRREQPKSGVGRAGKRSGRPTGAASVIGGYAASFTSSGLASWWR